MYSMERVRRRIFFWTLVVLFIIITPSIIMHARGYTFDLHRGVFVHSGSVMLKTNPQNFDVYINGQLQNSKQLNRINNSYNLTGLTPDNYNLSVTADGFQTWTKKTEVHSGLATEFWNVLLVRKNYDRTAYNTSGTDKFFFSPQDTKIAVVKNSAPGATVQILNISNKNTENSFFFVGGAFNNDERQENIEWSPNQDFLSIPLKMNPVTEKNSILPTKNAVSVVPDAGKYAYFIADPSTNNSFNLNSLLGRDDIRNVRWDPKDKRYLFFLSGSGLYRANLKDKNDLTLIADNVSAFDLSKDGVYYVQEPNDLIFKSNLDGTGDRFQLTSDFPDASNPLISKIIAYDDNRIALLTEGGKLFIFNKGDHGNYSRRLEDNIQGMQFSDDGKKMLYWSDNEIFVYFLRDWNVQPSRSENEIQSITRYAETVKNVQWFKDYEHIIFSAGPYVKIIELDARDHRNCLDILTTSTNTPFLTYDHALERLFFADTNGDASDLYSVVFPEPGAFLGIFPPAQQ